MILNECNKKAIQQLIINRSHVICIIKRIELYLLQLEAMIEKTRKQYMQIIHSEVAKSLEKLIGFMDELTCPTLIEHCRIWKAEKGARKLIQLAIEGDKFMSKESKMLKSSYHCNTKETGQHSLPTQSLFKKSLHKKALTKQNPESYKLQNSELIKKQEIFDESQVYGLYLTENCKKEQQNKIKIEQNLQDSIIQKENQSFSLENVMFENNFMEVALKRKNEKKCKRYLRGPYRNYTKQMKQKMVQLYKCNQLSVSKLSLQFGVPIKNIKRWAENGIERKEGAGRKRLDPQMQDQLCQKIKEKYQKKKQLSIQEIRVLALSLSKVADFKASKGWVISFIERHNLNEVYQIV